MLARNPEFITKFVHNFYCPSIFPALTCAAPPGSLLERNLQEFFNLRFAQPEREWVARQLSTPIIDLLDPHLSPLLIPLDSLINTSLTMARVLESFSRVAPNLATICAFRSNCTLTDESVNTLSLAHPTHLHLNRTVKLTDEGFASMVLRMSDSLHVLVLSDVCSLSDASYSAIGQLRVLQRLVLEVSSFLLLSSLSFSSIA